MKGKHAKQMKRWIAQAAVTQEQLAADSDLSYAALRAWINGERDPREESLRALATGLRKRAAVLLRIAAEVDNLTARPGRSDDE